MPPVKGTRGGRKGCGFDFDLLIKSVLGKRSASGPKGGLSEKEGVFGAGVGRLWASVGNAGLRCPHDPKDVHRLSTPALRAGVPRSDDRQ